MTLSVDGILGAAPTLTPAMCLASRRASGGGPV